MLSLFLFAFAAINFTFSVTQSKRGILLSGAGTTNPQNYFRTVMEYMTVESKLPVNTVFVLVWFWCRVSADIC